MSFPNYSFPFISFPLMYDALYRFPYVGELAPELLPSTQLQLVTESSPELKPEQFHKKLNS